MTWWVVWVEVLVSSNLGDVMNLMVNLVSDQTGLGNEVGLHSLVDGGSGDSSHGRDVVDNRGNNWGNSNRGSMSDSHRGSMSHSSHTVASVTQTMSKETVSGVTKTMSGQAKDRGIRLSGRSSHGGAQDGGKDNKGAHLAVR